MNPHQLQELLDEAQRRLRRTGDYLLEDTFPEQQAMILDESRLVAALCTRRAGKTSGAAIRLLRDAERFPDRKFLYLALTRKSAKGIFWKDGIKALNNRYKIGMTYHGTDLVATHPNGSEIFVAGADASPDDMEKLLGQKYQTVIIDESASWSQDQRSLVYGVLRPAVADHRGTIYMIGTPGNVTKSLFYDVTTGKERGWSVHKWNTFQNPFMAAQWQEEIEQLREMNPNIEKTPLFKQMYLGEWYIDHERLVYRYDERINSINTLPNANNQYFVVGVDLGYSPDPSAFVVCTYFEHDPNLYIVETYKKTEMIISDVAERIRYYMRAYPGAKIVIDAANKQAVEEMRQRFSLPIVSAEKQGKAGFIEIMNSDLARGVIKLLPEAKELAEEWASLVWDDNSDKRQESPIMPNHLADAALYAWRWAYNYAQKIPVKPILTEKNKVDNFWEKESNRLEQEKNLPPWEKDLDTEPREDIYGY